VASKEGKSVGSNHKKSTNLRGRRVELKIRGNKYKMSSEKYSDVSLIGNERVGKPEDGSKVR